MKPVTLSSIRRAARGLGAAFGARRVILFGSWARGQAGPASDVDLLVIHPKPGRNRRSLLCRMHAHLRDCDFAKDIVVVSPGEFERGKRTPGSVVRPAAAEGITLYAAP